MKIENYEIIEEVFKNIKEAYPKAKIWYDPQEEKIFYKNDSEVKSVNLKELVHEDIKLATMILEELLDQASVYYSEYVGTPQYEEKTFLKNDTEFLKRYIKLGLLFTHFLDRMIDSYDYIQLNDENKSITIDGSVAFNEKTYEFLKEVFKEREAIYEWKSED